MKLGRGHGGDGDGVSGRSRLSGGSCVRCVDVLFSGAKDGSYGVSLTKLRGKFINCVWFVYKGVSQYWK